MISSPGGRFSFSGQEGAPLKIIRKYLKYIKASILYAA